MITTLVQNVQNIGCRMCRMLGISRKTCLVKVEMDRMCRKMDNISNTQQVFFEIPNNLHILHQSSNQILISSNILHILSISTLARQVFLEISNILHILHPIFCTFCTKVVIDYWKHPTFCTFCPYQIWKCKFSLKYPTFCTFCTLHSAHSAPK